MHTLLKTGLLLVAVLALTSGLAPLRAEEDDDGHFSLDRLAAELAKAKVTLSVACDTAAKAAKGTAFAAKLEVEDGEVLYEVYVLVPGTPPRLFEVEVDAVTGKVIEMEEEGPGAGDDDEGEDDDDDGDDDE